MAYNTPWTVTNGASLATIDAILKEDYQGAVRDQLHREVKLLQLFSKGKASWNGKQFVISMRVGGNDTIGFRGEGDQLPQAGKQKFVRVFNSAKFLYGVFEIGGPDIAASANGGSMALANTLHDEMQYLVEDIKDFADRKMYHGGQVKGLINEKSAALTYTGTGVFSAAGNEVSEEVEYCGDFSYFNSCVAATIGTWVRVKLVEMSDYTEVPVPTGGELYVIAADEAGGKITLGLAMNGANTECDFSAGATTQTIDGVTYTVKQGVPVAVLLAEATPLSAVGLPTGLHNPAAPGSAGLNSALEFSGLLDNLCNPSHHGESRVSGGNAGNPADKLQATALCMKSAASDKKIAISADRWQQSVDIMRNLSRRKPDVYLTNPLTRHKYIAASTVTINTDIAGSTGADRGFKEESLGFAGTPIQVDSNCPKSLIFGLHLSSWKVYELKAGDFDDTDGKVLRKLAQEDRFEGVWKWYLELICDYPNANMILCGFHDT